MKRLSLFFVSLLMLAGFAAPVAAAPGAASWTARLEPKDIRAGEGGQLVVEATIKEPWHVYSATKRAGGGPLPTSIEVLPNKAVTAAGPIVQPPPIKEFDKGFKIEVEMYGGAVAFGLPVKLASGIAGAQKVVVKVRSMACKEGTCEPPKTAEIPVAFTVAAGPARPARTAPVKDVPKQPEGAQAPVELSPDDAPPAGGATGSVGDIQRAQQSGLLAFLGLSIGAGFLALLTPCVFPMVPITVSFFAKQQEDAPGRGVQMAVAYCLGIIFTFTGLGLLLSMVFGAAGINMLATNPYVNLGMAALFIFLAFSLFGMFELALPPALLEKVQGGTGRGRFLGPLLMGLAFTLTSFTCTVPFVGALLGASATGSPVWAVVGMLGFSTAFASPFFLLALFPQWLARLPKSGPWLVTVKAFMGFLELAAALKFLSNADLYWEVGLLTRPVFLAIWFALAAVAACYMLGWLRLPHDDEGTQIGLFRKGIGVGTAVLAFYILLGMNGRSLGQFTGFLPPRVYPGTRAPSGPETTASAGHAINWLEDYDAAVKLAKAENKPLFLNFTGVMCTNCRVMEDEVFPRPEVADELKNFVAVELFTDKDDAQSRRYQEFQLKQFRQTTLPLYVVVTPDGKSLGEASFNPNVRQFAEFLQKARAEAGRLAQSN